MPGISLDQFETLVLSTDAGLQDAIEGSTPSFDADEPLNEDQPEASTSEPLDAADKSMPAEVGTQGEDAQEQLRPDGDDACEQDTADVTPHDLPAVSLPPFLRRTSATSHEPSWDDGNEEDAAVDFQDAEEPAPQTDVDDGVDEAARTTLHDDTLDGGAPTDERFLAPNDGEWGEGSYDEPSLDATADLHVREAIEDQANEEDLVEASFPDDAELAQEDIPSAGEGAEEVVDDALEDEDRPETPDEDLNEAKEEAPYESAWVEEEDAGTSEYTATGFVSALSSAEGYRHAREREDDVPNMRTFLVAAAASLVLVGGGILCITHPWDRTYNDMRATEERDTSYAGFPGELESLSGQDQGADDEDASAEASPEALEAYEELQSCYDRLVALRSRLGECDMAARALSYDTLVSVREAATEEALVCAKELNELVDEISQMSYSSTEYRQSRNKLIEMSSYLSRWADVVTSAWETALNDGYEYFDLDTVLYLISQDDDEDGVNPNATGFDEVASTWSLQAPA